MIEHIRNIKDVDWTPIDDELYLLSCRMGHIPYLIRFMDTEEELFVTDEMGNTSLHFAAANNKYEVIPLIINELKKRNETDQDILTMVNHVNNTGNLSLHWAIQNGS